MRQKDRDDPVGDLAKDAARDKESDVVNRKAIYRHRMARFKTPDEWHYLLPGYCNQNVHDTVNRAWREYHHCKEVWEWRQKAARDLAISST